jgi:chromosomal replication initiator protein
LPTTRWNFIQPIIDFGGGGLGKTHLAHAVELKIIPEKKTVLYISAEIFTQQYIDSVKKNNRNDFIHFYQLIDVLIIDDVQFYPVNLELRMCFSTSLITYIKRKTLTSDKAPLICKISSNDYYLVSNGDCQQNCTNRITKQEFLSYPVSRGVEIPEEIIEYVARNIKSNVENLKGHNIPDLIFFQQKK